MLPVQYRGFGGRRRIDSLDSGNESNRSRWILLVVALLVLSGILFLAGERLAGWIVLGISPVMAFIGAQKLIYDETVKRVAQLDVNKDSIIIQVPGSYSDPGLP